MSVNQYILNMFHVMSDRVKYCITVVLKTVDFYVFSLYQILRRYIN